ncbi:MAG: ZPR1 zinc finger domain-containing protein [Candidatus Diapherotrites archaeon]
MGTQFEHMLIACPECKAKASMVETVEEVPNFGKVLISTIKCSSCGYRMTDVMSVELRGPMLFSKKISGPKDIYAKIVRNSSATVEVPELGVKIFPGPKAEGFISNVEGLLERIENAVGIIARSEKGAKKKNAEKKLAEILMAKEGKKKITVKLLDPFGASAIIGGKVTKKKLSKKEAGKLKKNILVFEK